MTGPAVTEQPTNPEAEKASQRRVALYHYLMQAGGFGDDSDPAFIQYKEEAEQLRQANPLTELANRYTALYQDAIDKQDLSRWSFFIRLLDQLKHQQSRLQLATRVQVLQDVAMQGDFFSPHIRESVHIRVFIYHADDRQYIDEILNVCSADAPSFTDLQQREDYWERQDNVDGGGYSLSSPHMPTSINGISMGIGYKQSDSYGNKDVWSIHFYLTPEVAEISAKAPLIEIPVISGTP